MRCPLCEGVACHHFLTVEGREYWRCEDCLATFLHPAQLPSREAELARYRLHRNDRGDAGYRRFLGRLASPLLERLPLTQRGLDYGCGPEPVLAMMLREAGHDVALFDPLFQTDGDVLARTYDFIACSEVAEHFHHPADEFERLDALLAPGGWLALMTAFLTDDAAFARWHYRSDPTHVLFYREETLRFLARRRGWRCEIPCTDVALMQKPTA